VQRRRDKAAVAKLMRKLLNKQGFAPDVVVTDKLRSYGAAKSAIGLSARHRQGLRRNNRAEKFGHRSRLPWHVVSSSVMLRFVYQRATPLQLEPRSQIGVHFTYPYVRPAIKIPEDLLLYRFAPSRADIRNRLRYKRLREFQPTPLRHSPPCLTPSPPPHRIVFRLEPIG
jgi:hypothetical protein